MEEPTGTLVLLDQDCTYAIYWNGSATYNVWSILGDVSSFRPLRNVNAFTSYGAMTWEQGASEAAWWWENGGLEATIELDAAEHGQ